MEVIDVDAPSSNFDDVTANPKVSPLRGAMATPYKEDLLGQVTCQKHLKEDLLMR